MRFTMLPSRAAHATVGAGTSRLATTASSLRHWLGLQVPGSALAPESFRTAGCLRSAANALREREPAFALGGFATFER
jgi:hypothetical protein